MISLSSQCRTELESAIEHPDKELSETCRTELKTFVTKNTESKNGNNNNNNNNINSNNGMNKYTSSSSISSKQNRVVISNMINGWEFEIASGIVIMLILLLYYFIAKNNKASNRNSKIKFRTPPKTKKPGKDKEKR